MYDIKDKNVIVSRDVVFYEKHFPYHLHTPTSSPYATFYLPTSTIPENVPLWTDDFGNEHVTLRQINSNAPNTSTPTLKKLSSITTPIPIIQHATTPIHQINSIPNNTSTPNIHELNNLPVTNTPIISRQAADNTPHNTSHNTPHRRSERLHKPPSYLSDYVCQNSAWCNIVAFSNLPHKSQIFLEKQSQWTKPTNYNEAVKDNN